MKKKLIEEIHNVVDQLFMWEVMECGVKKETFHFLGTKQWKPLQKSPDKNFTSKISFKLKVSMEKSEQR